METRTIPASLAYLSEPQHRVYERVVRIVAPSWHVQQIRFANSPLMAVQATTQHRPDAHAVMMVTPTGQIEGMNVAGTMHQLQTWLQIAIEAQEQPQ